MERTDGWAPPEQKPMQDTAVMIERIEQEYQQSINKPMKRKEETYDRLRLDTTTTKKTRPRLLNRIHHNAINSQKELVIERTH